MLFESGKGAAYAFGRSGGIWVQQQEFIANDGSLDGVIALSARGDTAVISAPLRTVGANLNQGVAYIFTRTGTTWSQQQMLVAADGKAFDGFGVGVALSGDGGTAAITEVGHPSSALHIFVRSGVTWGLQMAVVPNSVENVALTADGNTLFFRTNQDYAYQNMVDVLTRSGSTWTTRQEISTTDNHISTFGWPLAIDGDGTTLMVGARGPYLGRGDPGNPDNYGPSSVFVFVAAVDPLPGQRPTATTGSVAPAPLPVPRGGPAAPGALSPGPAPVPLPPKR